MHKSDAKISFFFKLNSSAILFVGLLVCLLVWLVGWLVGCCCCCCCFVVVVVVVVVVVGRLLEGRVWQVTFYTSMPVPTFKKKKKL